MLIFLDETFRKGRRGHELGALCGVAIPEDLYARVTEDIYGMKVSSFGEQFAKERELKGKLLLKQKNLEGRCGADGRAYVTFVHDVLRYLRRQNCVTFGVVCFDIQLRTFRCNDPLKLDPTYRALFERIDAYMRQKFPTRIAKLIFDTVDHKYNKTRAESVTNFFTRSPVGRGFDTIMRAPFFAVSEAQNVGLQLADILTTVCGMRFQGNEAILPIWRLLQQTLYSYKLGAMTITTLKVFHQR